MYDPATFSPQSTCNPIIRKLYGRAPEAGHTATTEIIRMYLQKLYRNEKLQDVPVVDLESLVAALSLESEMPHDTAEDGYASSRERHRENSHKNRMCNKRISYLRRFQEATGRHAHQYLDATIYQISGKPAPEGIQSIVEKIGFLYMLEYERMYNKTLPQPLLPDCRNINSNLPSSWSPTSTTTTRPNNQHDLFDMREVKAAIEGTLGNAERLADEAELDRLLLSGVEVVFPGEAEYAEKAREYWASPKASAWLAGKEAGALQAEDLRDLRAKNNENRKERKREARRAQGEVQVEGIIARQREERRERRRRTLRPRPTNTADQLRADLLEDIVH